MSISAGNQTGVPRVTLAAALAVFFALVGSVALGVARWESERSLTLELPAVVVTSPAGPPWVIRSPSGAIVRVSPSVQPLHVGPARFEIAIDRLLPSTASVTVDLVSPTMPMHGITRFNATRAREGVYVAWLELPMEGRWALYVNLAGEADGAAVEFDVATAPGASGGMPPSYHAGHGS